MFFVLVSVLDLSILKQVLLFLCFLSFCLAALFTGLLWQTGIGYVTRSLIGTASPKTERVVHGMLMIVSGISLVLMVYLVHQINDLIF